MIMKVCVLIALAIAGASAQLVPENAAPEPYSYAYDTDTHSAAEQRDPSGKVTGYYTIADADGRQRRVEYIADEAGFRAKVQTNEVGTKSENSADVEVLASPPNREQFVQTVQTVQQAPPVPVPQLQVQRAVTQQVVGAPQTAFRQQSVSYAQQPGYAYGYQGAYNYPGATYGTGYGYGLANNQYYSYGQAAPSSAAYGAVNYGTYSGYNNHLPSSYYRSVGYSQPGVGVYSSGANRVGQYVSTVGVPASSTSSTYRNYQSVGVQPAVATRTTYTSSVPATSNLSGSSNYIVLKKRSTADKPVV